MIVGAGPAGLAMGWRLERAGIPALMLERAGAVASSWRSYYDSVQLFSARRISSLPGMTIPREAGSYPRRKALIEYFEDYAAQLRTAIRLGVEVRRIDRDGDAWLVRTSDGDLRARHVVMATGLNAAPHRPRWPGEEGFAGRIVPLADFRNGAAFRGLHVLVVGAGTTGTDIAWDLYHWGAERVDVAVRTPPHVLPLKFLGVPIQYGNKPLKRDWFPQSVHNWLSKAFHRMANRELHEEFGLPRASWGHVEMYAGPRGHGINFDRGGITLIKQRKVGLVAALERFAGDEVVLADGRRLRPDVVIPATGRKPALDPIVGHLGLLGAHGRPLVHGGRTSPAAPNLFFLGYRMPPPQLPDLKPDSRAICRRIVADRRAGAGRRLEVRAA